MMKETQQSLEDAGNHGGGVFASGQTACEKAQFAAKRPRWQGKTEGGATKSGKKDLQTCATGRKSRKRPTLVVGKKPYGKSQFSSLAHGHEMRKKNRNESSSKRREKNPAKPSIGSAPSFFHKTGGVFLICILLFGLTAWTFAFALQCDYQIFDERGELLLNSHVNSGVSWKNLSWAVLSMEYSNWYPITWISQMLDYTALGARAWGHHLTNVVLHAANGVLLFLVLKKMTGALWRSLIVAALFALHPLRVESVAWISERKDVLSAFFGLLAFWTYARFAEASNAPAADRNCFTD